MDDVAPEKGNGILRGIVRRLVPWLALIVVATLAWSYLGQYREALESRPSDETTGTVETSSSAAPGGTYVLVVANELNLRAEAMTTATIVKKLKKDEKLTLLEKKSSWYKVQDAAGAVGWVAAGGQYTEIVEP